MKNLIGGRHVDSSDGKVIEVINPATLELIDTVPASVEQDVETCIREAKEAQRAWAVMPLHERGAILYKFADLVEARKEELAQLLSKETGKPIKEARIEIGNTRLFAQGYVEKAKHEYGDVIPSGSEPGQEKTLQLTVQAPIGVVACIIPFNFPCDLFGQKVPSALIMGNSVIVKPASDNPLTLVTYCDILMEAGVPAGVINCITGSGSVVGSALAKHPDIGLITVTGSTEVGAEVMSKAGQNITHVMLELGGNDAFIVMNDADLNLAIEEMVWGRLYNTGQVCCASKRFLVQKEVKEQFLRLAIEKIKTLKVAMPQEEDADIGCLINEKAAIRAEQQVQKTIDQGAVLVYGGRRNGAFFEPTILDHVTKEMDVMKDMEIFAPVIPICEFDTVEEAIAIANQSRFGLCGNVMTRDMKTAFKVATALEVGGAVINGASFYRAAEMPFGGWKHSGLGNEGISTTLREMSRTKTIVLKNIFD